MPEATDQATLVEQAAGGDPDAAWKLFSPHGETLLTYLERHFPPHLRPDLEPQDILQDTFFQAFRRIGQFHPEGKDAVWRWLATIARNLLTAALRRQQASKRGQRADEDGDGEPLTSMLEELAVHRRTPSRSAIAHELVVALEISLQRLPDDYRTVLQLRYMEGLDADVVAERMNRAPGALRMLCSRALSALRAQMRTASLRA